MSVAAENTAGAREAFFDAHAEEVRAAFAAQLAGDDVPMATLVRMYWKEVRDGN